MHIFAANTSWLIVHILLFVNKVTNLFDFFGAHPSPPSLALPDPFILLLRLRFFVPCSYSCYYHDCSSFLFLFFVSCSCSCSCSCHSFLVLVSYYRHCCFSLLLVFLFLFLFFVSCSCSCHSFLVISYYHYCCCSLLLVFLFLFLLSVSCYCFLLSSLLVFVICSCSCASCYPFLVMVFVIIHFIIIVYRFAALVPCSYPGDDGWHSYS